MNHRICNRILITLVILLVALFIASVVSCDGNNRLADNDGDGYAIAQDDCDDDNAEVYPGAPELCDGLDNDCDGRVPDDEEIGDDGLRGCQRSPQEADPITPLGFNVGA